MYVVIKACTVCICAYIRVCLSCYGHLIHSTVVSELNYFVAINLLICYHY